MATVRRQWKARSCTHAFPAVYNPDGTIDWAATTRDYVVTLTVVDDSDPALSDSDTAIVHITAPP